LIFYQKIDPFIFQLQRELPAKRDSGEDENHAVIRDLSLSLPTLNFHLE